jgi:cytochrome c oxidase subunit 1
MPRRVADYIPAFADWNMLSSIGAFLIAISVAIFLYNMLVSLRSGPIVGSADPWGGTPRPEWQHGYMPNPQPPMVHAEPHDAPAKGAARRED